MNRAYPGGARRNIWRKLRRLLTENSISNNGRVRLILLKNSKNWVP